MKIKPYIDFHTHKSIFDDDSDVIEIISCHKTVKQNFSNFHTLGFHPWWTEQAITFQELHEMKQHVSIHHTCLAVGECGLDKLRGSTKEIQEQVFLQQISLANEIQCPLIIHCVRQYDIVMKLRQYGKTPWVIHGFRRNHILAKSLLDLNIKLSVSPFLGMNASFVEMMSYLPIDMFFIETDSEDRMSIKERYGLMAELKKIDIFALREKMYDNVTDFFKWKNINLIGLKEQSY